MLKEIIAILRGKPVMANVDVKDSHIEVKGDLIIGGRSNVFRNIIQTKNLNIMGKGYDVVVKYNTIMLEQGIDEYDYISVFGNTAYCGGAYEVKPKVKKVKRRDD